MLKKFCRNHFFLFIIIVLLHIAAIFGPIAYYYWQYDEEKQREIAFKVELGGTEPSHAPEVGPPERRPPSETPGEAPPPPAPPQDDAAERQRQEQQRQQAERQRQEQQRQQAERQRQEQQRQQAERQRQEQQRRQQAERQRQEQQRRQQAERQRQEQQRRQQAERQRQEQQRRQAEQRRRQLEAERQRRERESVHTDPNAGSFDPNKRYGGGQNRNQNVRTGNRDTGQRQGEVDSRTPAGGATAEMAQRVRTYINDIIPIISRRWIPPAGVFVTQETAVRIQVDIDPRGNFRGRIIRRSPIEAVNRSAEAMLATFSTLPAPPEAVSFTVTLIPEQ